MKRLLLLLSVVGFWQISNAQCPPAAPLATPFYENFDAEAGGQTGVFSNCWTGTTATTNPKWETETSGTSNSGGTGPLNDFSGTGVYVFLETSGGAQGDTAGLITPPIDLTGLVVPELTFYYHMYGAAMGSLSVEIWNGSSWTSELAIVGQQHLSETAPWSKGIVGLSAYSGVIQIKFIGMRGSSFTSDASIDEVRVQEAPACPQPTGITIANLAGTSADVNWTTVAAATSGYEVIYGAAGFNPASGGTSATTATTSYSITGLSGATKYDAYVISDCAASGISDTSGPVSFTTLCLPFTVGYVNNFDSDALDVPPLCWADYKTNAASWVEVEDFTGTSAPYSPPQALYLYGSSATAAADTLYAISPDFSDLTAGDKQVHFQANSDGPLSQLIIGTVADQMSPETFVAIDTITFIAPDTYQEVIVPISVANGYNGTHQYVAFAHSLGQTFQYIRIDDFSYEAIPACSQITGVGVTATTDSSATFTFTSSGTNVDVEWGVVGFTPGTGCIATNVAAAGTFTISDGMAAGCALSLAPATTYEFYVRNNCSGTGNGVSPYAGPTSFTTSPPGPSALNCTVGNPSIIFSEEFDAVGSWTGNLGSSGGNWEIPGNATSTNTGPNTAHSGAANSYTNFEASGAGTSVGAIVSPAIDLTPGASDAELSFWMYAYGADMGTLDVGVSTSPTGPFTTVFTWTGQFQTSATDLWVNVGADLTPYLGSIIYIELKQSHSTTGFTGDMAIDLLEVSTCLSCANPSLLATSNITGTSADLAWQENGIATQWELSYGPQGFTPGNGLGALVTGNPHTISGLMPATNHDWYVRAICGPGDTSGWVGPSSFFTLCAPIPAPYFQNFESGFAAGSFGPNINPCFNSIRTTNPRWEAEDASGANENSSNTGPFYDNTFYLAAGGHYLYLETSGGAGLTDTLTSPEIDVTSLTVPYLEFAYHMYGATMGTLDVEVWDGSTWSAVTSIVGQQQTAGNDPWLISGTPLTGLTGDTLQFRFIGTSGTSFNSDMSIDDMAVYEAPSCFKPTMLGVVTTDDQNATIYWTGGGAANYNVQYGPVGFVPGTGTIVNSTNDTLTITGLTAATAYEFYVRDSCGLGDVSLWAGPTPFSTTACAASSTCTYSADLFDSFGDGWNGALATVWQGGLPVATLGAGFTTGNNFPVTFDVCDGLMTFVTLSNGGGFPSEVGIYVMDRAGDTIVSYPNSGTTATGDTLGMFTVDCSKCPVFAAPFMETFEANSPSASCWTNEYVAEAFDWTVGTGAGGGVITSAYAGTQNAVFISQNPGGTPEITRYVSPAVDISALSAPELRFWYGQEVWFSDQNYLNVYYRTDTASAWMLLWSDSTNQPAWTEGVISLPMGSSTYQVAFEGINNWGRANVLDNVSIMDAPACPAPTALGVTNITDVTADIYWTGGGSATNWLVKYDDGTTATIVASANDTITLTGLTAGTGYTVHVKDSCGAANVSVWAGPLTFNTALCGPANSCDFQALLQDGFGDGWNGAEVTVYQNGVAVQVLGTGFLTGSTFGPVTVPLCDGLSTHFVLTNGGGFPSEVGMDLDDPFGAFVATYAPSGATAQGDTLISIVSSCAAPSCPPPSNLGATNVTTTSADLFWTGAAGAMMYNVQYGPQGFVPGTGTIVASANDTLNLVGLSSSQCFDFWVQSDCGVDSSIYIGPFAFCTLCAPINTFPYTEGFGSAPVTALPACYYDSTFSSGTTDFLWLVDAGGTGTTTSGPAADNQGSATGNYVYTEASGPTPGDSAFLFLPEFDITSMTNPELVFYFHMYGADITTLTVEVFDAVSSSWTAVDSIVGQQQTASGDAWQERRLNLTAYSSSSLLIRFLHVRGASFAGDVSLDDITIRETPSCVDPSALMVTGFGLTSVDLTWVADTNITGSAVQYGPVGFTLGTGTTVGATSGMSSVTGLMSGVCYDFYVQDSCGGATNWVGPVTECTKSTCGVSGLPGNVMGDSTGCGGGGVTLTAQAPAGMTLAWYNGGQLVGSGSPYIDTIGITTNYEVRNVSLDGTAMHLGPQPNLVGGFGNFVNGQYLTILDTLVIDSVTVRSNGLVNAQVIITDGENVLAGGTILQRGEIFTTPSGITANTQVPVGIVLIPGSYFIAIDFLPGTVGALFRSTGGAAYPYTLLNRMSIDSVDNAPTRYYYTFDLVIQEACISTMGLPAVGYVPGANAGTSDSVTVCETNSAVDLSSYLGVYDYGGTWTDDDATGALTDSIFDATAVIAGGTYNFSYIISQSGACVGGDTATISITVEASPFAGNDTSLTVCVSAVPIQLRALLSGSDNGGTMTDLDGSGGLVGTLFLPASAGPGTYRFSYQVNGVACPNDTALITITVDDDVDAGSDASDTITDCTNPIDLNTYLSATATAGGTWVDASGSGALTGSSFDPAAAANLASYDFRYVLTSAACGDDSSTVTLFLDCTIGLDEYTVGNIDVYPNPTKGVVNIEALTNDNKIKSVEVYSLSGALIVKRTADDTTIRLDLSGYADGLYNIKVTSERGVELHRINKK